MVALGFGFSRDYPNLALLQHRFEQQ